MNSYDWLETAKRLNAIAQAGLHYTESDYDRDRYMQVREIAHRILNHYTGVAFEKLPGLFSFEKGYQTPKIDVRGVVVSHGKMLLVRERTDGLWSLPGGWCDVGFSPSKMVEKEVWEEAGVKVRAARLLAVLDKSYHQHPPDPFHSYKLFFHCHFLGGTPSRGMETLDTGWFTIEELPPLSIERNTEAQVETMFSLIDKPDHPTVFD